MYCDFMKITIKLLKSLIRVHGSEIASAGLDTLTVLRVRISLPSLAAFRSVKAMKRKHFFASEVGLEQRKDFLYARYYTPATTQQSTPTSKQLAEVPL